MVEDHISEGIKMCSESSFKRIKYSERDFIVESNGIEVEAEIVENDLDDISVDSRFKR